MIYDPSIGGTLLHQVDKGHPCLGIEGEYRTGRVLGIAHQYPVVVEANLDAFIVQVAASCALAPRD